MLFSKIITLINFIGIVLLFFLSDTLALAASVCVTTEVGNACQ